MLEILSFELGPVITNTYILADTETNASAVIDPAWEGQRILKEALSRSWQIQQLWYTHAHFDHIGGAADLAKGLDPQPAVGLHHSDQLLWQAKGGAMLFGFDIDAGPEPSIELTHGSVLKLGSYAFEVRHTPGHTPGHCVFYCAEEKVCFSGDLIFQGSVGRTDLPGGSWKTLLASIHEQIFSLPGDTRLLSGHGPATTVEYERQNNPFVNGYP